MGLAAGHRIGPYEIVAPLGAGGMGEVYRAKDLKLGREVAIKVLPARTAEDPEALARFEREARAVAALSHPNILAIHDFGREGETPYAVMELLEGETLRERLKSGPLPPRRALEIARQVAAGLAAAHERGIVHRDLKPENLFATRDGRVKILDFGLAKQNAAGGGTMSADTPTRSISTEPGVVMGTAGYMAPEQVRGLPADARSDLFAFGAVLYELLSGTPAFRRETAADTMSAILREEPPEFLAGSAAQIPALERIVRRCLEKDPVARFHSASDLGFALDSLPGPAGASGAHDSLAPASSRRRERALWLTALGLCAVGAAWAGLRLRSGAAPPAFRATLLPPDEAIAAKDGFSPDFALSPDGRRLALVTSPDGKTNYLWVRPLDSLFARRIEGTEWARDPFWSPDGRSLGFFAGEQLKTVSAEGGTVSIVCAVKQSAGGAWLADGTILIGSWAGPLSRVAASGGNPASVTELDTARGEFSHAWPRPLPDGRHVLIYRNGTSQDPAHPGQALYAVAPDGKASKLVLGRWESFSPQVVDGHLLYENSQQQLLAAPFDERALRVTGPARVLAEKVGAFSAARGGMLVYQPDFAHVISKLTWYDATGKRLAELGEFGILTEGNNNEASLSPDGRWLSLALYGRTVEKGQLWLIDTQRGIRRRVSQDDSNSYGGAFSPDSRRIYFSSDRNGYLDLFVKELDGGDEAPVLVSKANKVAEAVSPDGETLIYFQTGDPQHPEANGLWTLSLSGDPHPRPLDRSRFNEWGALLSPDGKWLSFYSDESGEMQMYVAAFPGMNGRQVVTSRLGALSHWRPDGRAILTSRKNTLLSIDVRTSGGRIDFGEPRELFSLPDAPVLTRFWVSPSDGRYLIQTTAERVTPPLTLITNWNATPAR